MSLKVRVPVCVCVCVHAIVWCFKESRCVLFLQIWELRVRQDYISDMKPVLLRVCDLKNK